MLSRRLRASRPDTGSITLVTVILGGMMLAFVGFVWDGGQAVSAQQTANDLALDAGRTAAQCVDVKYFLEHGTATVGSKFQADACAAPYAQLYNDAKNDYQMKVDIAPFTTPDGHNMTFLKVTVTLTRPTGFLSGLGLTGTYIGHATVKLTQGVTDAGG